MKVSLRFRITLILTVSILVLVFVSWLSNELFLEKFYLQKKVNSLSNTYNQVNLIAGTGLITEEERVISDLEKIEAGSNVNIYLISDLRAIGTPNLRFEYPLRMDMSGAQKGSIIRNDRLAKIGEALAIYRFGEDLAGDNSYTHITTYSDRYDVYCYHDGILNSDYIDLVGFIDNGCCIFLRLSYENISESVDITGRFLAIVGIIVAVLGSVFMYIFSRKFTMPILELADISDEMAALNFETKYTDTRNDEIGQLGASINKLSDKLKHTISELKTANIELERDIRQKTELDEMRKEFLSNVSHELKTPIALIQGYAEGLQDNINDDPESRSFYCDVIIDEARKMNELVRKLLTLNEIELGRDKLDLTRFDIVEMTRSVTASVDILTKNEGIELIFNEHEPIYVWADATMIEEVITNYLSNAIHYASGRKLIDISFSTDDSKVRVSIFNTGDNIPADELEHIWDKFYKVDKARTREYGGSGIGLSIVKAIMDQHNRNCGVANHKAGVEFWFELDIRADE